MLIGYARVSTLDQNLDLQSDALTGAGCDEIYSDVASGAKDARPGLAEALERLREGDTLIVWKLDRLGRSMTHLVATVNELAAREVEFQSVQEKSTPLRRAANFSSTFSRRWPSSSATSCANAPTPD